MPASKSPRLFSSSGLVRLTGNALMGAAFGLCFTLALVVTNPAVAQLLTHVGDDTTLVVVFAVITTFAVGAALTGAIFILTEDM